MERVRGNSRERGHVIREKGEREREELIARNKKRGEDKR